MRRDVPSSPSCRTPNWSRSQTDFFEASVRTPGRTTQSSDAFTFAFFSDVAGSAADRRAGRRACCCNEAVELRGFPRPRSTCVALEVAVCNSATMVVSTMVVNRG